MPVHLCMPIGLKSLPKVLVKDFTHKKRKEGTLDLQWLGPYYIMRNLGKVTYLLHEESTLVEKKINGAHIKPYIACGSEIRISKPASRNIQLTAHILSTCTTNSLVVAVKITAPFLQNLYQLQPQPPSVNQKVNETIKPVGEIIEVKTYKVPGRRKKTTVWVKNCLYELKEIFS